MLLNRPRIPTAIDANATLRGFLSSGESENTDQQFIALRSEMLRLMNRSRVLESEIVSLCGKLKLLWTQVGHDPQDLLEVKICYKPKSIRCSPLSVMVIGCMLSSWSEIAEKNRPLDDGEADSCNTTKIEEAREQLSDLLSVCNVSEGYRWDILQSCKSVVDCNVRYARIFSCIDALKALLEKVSAMPLPPRTISHQMESDEYNDVGVTTSSLSASEQWVSVARQVLEECKSWELLSGVPFCAHAGPTLFLRRNLPSQDESQNWSYVELLGKVLERVEKID